MRTIRVTGAEAARRAIREAVRVLRDGGIVAYPTDTLYGLAVDPRRDDAVDRLFAAKERDARIAVPLIAAGVAQARSAAVLGQVDLRLAERFWPGPLTIVAPAMPGISRLLLGGSTSVAVRVPAHDVARLLAEKFGYCITATSANLSGRAPADRADAIDAALRHHVDVLLDAGPTPGGAPSTIVRAESSGVRLLRAGAIAWERVLESLE